MEPLESHAFVDRLKSVAELSDCDFYRRIIGSESYIPGDIEQAFSLFMDGNGRTSYEVLVHAIPDLKKKIVVDLASGSGPVAKAVITRTSEAQPLILVDFNALELEKARRDLATASAKFLEEPVQELSLSDESVDVVFCHLGLMLFGPLDSALDSIARVLKPEGSLVFNKFREEIGEVETAYLDVIIRHEDAIPNFMDHGYGDSRTHTQESLSRLFSTTGNFESLTFEDYEVSFRGKPAEMYEALKTYYQLGYLLDEENAHHLKEELLLVLQAGVDATGLVAFTLPLTTVSTRKVKSQLSSQ